MGENEIFIGNHRICYPVGALLAAGIALTGAVAVSLVDFLAFSIPVRIGGSNHCTSAGHPVPSGAITWMAPMLTSTHQSTR